MKSDNSEDLIEEKGMKIFDLYYLMFISEQLFCFFLLTNFFISFYLLYMLWNLEFSNSKILKS